MRLRRRLTDESSYIWQLQNRTTLTRLRTPNTAIVKIRNARNSLHSFDDLFRIDPHYFDPSSDYFFVVIPIALQALCSLLDALNGDNTCYTLANYNFNMLFTSLVAIPLNTINTSSQINPNQLTSFHIISSIDSTGISIMLPFTAFTDTDSANNDTVTINSGGNFILLGHISQITTGYPNPNSYTIGLPAIYHNVISIKLASTEIPNANKTIRDYPSASVNNKLYWNDIDDGDYLYQISVPAGNYTPDDLITASHFTIWSHDHHHHCNIPTNLSPFVPRRFSD